MEIIFPFPPTFHKFIVFNKILYQLIQRKQLEQQLIEKSMKDPGFRKRLIEEPLTSLCRKARPSRHTMPAII